MQTVHICEESYRISNSTGNIGKTVSENWEPIACKFGNHIMFYKPTHTVAVSITGAECGLDCAHCGKHYLRGMVPIIRAQQEAEKRGAGSLLISGGCDQSGRIKLDRFIDMIKILKRYRRINLHVGIPNHSDIEAIKELADVVSLDIPASDNIIKKVYGLELTTGHYIRSYKILRCEVEVVPHICLGLEEEVEPEIELIDTLKEAAPEKLCIIIFTPTRGTRLENRPPPDINNVLAVITRARTRMPDTNIILGCMRPGGEYRKKLDEMAVEAGINGIVMPAISAVRRAEELGLETEWNFECCALGQKVD